MTNIKELKEVVIFGLTAAKLLKTDLADGKLSLLEIFGLYKLISPAHDAFQGIALIPGELNDLSSEESAELVDLVRQVLEQDITDTAALAKAEQALSAMDSLLSTIAMFRGINPNQAPA